MDAMESIIKNLDWSPLFISLKTGIMATFISFFLGIYAARKVVKTTPGKKAVIDGILTLPMVLHWRRCGRAGGRQIKKKTTGWKPDEDKTGIGK